MLGDSFWIYHRLPFLVYARGGHCAFVFSGAILQKILRAEVANMHN
jgi:hypothetical protein